MTAVNARFENGEMHGLVWDVRARQRRRRRWVERWEGEGRARIEMV